MAKENTAEPVSYQNGHIIERPDGFYWQEKHSGDEYGPFGTLREAEDDMEFGLYADGDDVLDGAEDEIGIADWIDPDTGEPAEESVPHIKDN